MAIGRSSAALALLTGSSRHARPLLVGLSIGGVVMAVGLFVIGHMPGYDLYAYWLVDPLDPYGISQGMGIFRYSPVLATVFQPLKLLAWPDVYWLWVVLMFLVLVWLMRRWTLAALMFVPIVLELYEGNIHLLIAAAIILGLRWPAAWSFLVLTKITPGVAILWFAVRHEWRSLGIVVGVTAVLILVSALPSPGLWESWLAHLIPAGAFGAPNQIAIPLLVRLPIAAVVVAWGARANRPWTLAVGTTLALPIVWFHGLAILAAIPALLDPSRTGLAPRPSAMGSSDGPTASRTSG